MTMVSKIIPITRTTNGTPVIGAGGGAFTNTYQATTALRPTKEGFALKRAAVIKQTGHRESSLEQAIIPIEIGDVIVSLYGKLPINDENPEAIIAAFRIVSIKGQKVIADPIELFHQDIPLSIIQGAGTYHNKDGNFFCLEPEQKD